jgi:hypothetical protein
VDGSIVFFTVSAVAGAGCSGASASDGSRKNCVAINRYSASASKAPVAIENMSRLKVMELMELMGYCKSPVANLSMGLEIGIDYDDVSKLPTG